MRTTAKIVAASCLHLLAVGAFAKEPVDYVNTEIGTISHMLVPCFQTTQLPNAMLRVLPPYRDFTDDRVSAIHLLTPDHRGQQVFAVHPFSDAANPTRRRSSRLLPTERLSPGVPTGTIRSPLRSSKSAAAKATTGSDSRTDTLRDFHGYFCVTFPL